MKRYLFCIFMLFNSINITATKYDNEEYIVTHKNGDRSFTLYASYFLIKEFCKAVLLVPFIDLKKIKNTTILCCKDNHKIDAQYLWIHLIFKFDQPQIDELKNHIYNDSTEELALFVLQKSQELELDCRECGEYSGYYIPEEEPASQS